MRTSDGLRPNVILTRCVAAIGAAISGAVAVPVDARAQVPVDLELVLAVDASGSVDSGEFSLQLGGIAAALRDGDVIEAIGRGIHGRIAIAMVIWSAANSAKDKTGWHLIGSHDEALAAARFFENHPRRIRGESTGIGAGIAAGITMFEGNGFAGIRRVIDVSGDGIETPPERIGGDTRMLLDEATRIAGERRVVVNGLAILNEVAKLDEYYDRNVRVGPGSFVMSAQDYNDFAAAMRAKLLREIDTGLTVSDSAPGGPEADPADRASLASR